MLRYTDTVRGKIHASGLFGRANVSLHRALERNRSNGSYPDVLEIGAGDLEHLGFVEHVCERYCAIDLREPADADAAIVRRPPNIGSVSVLTMDGTALDFPDDTFDRVLATCVLMHVERPDLALLEWVRVAKPGGVIDFLVPCDPGLVLRMFRWLINERAAMRFGVSRWEYRILNAIDHVSSFARIDALVRLVVEESGVLELRAAYHPFRVPSWNLNGFVVYSIRKAVPDLEGT